MASKRIMNANKYLAKLALKCSSCAFCNRIVDEETLYGKLYSIGDIHCHYFCVLLSCCLIQKGRDEEGLFGFMYLDILAEIERSKKHKCSYCGRVGATLGCSVAQCKKQFHLPCGRQKNAVSLFYGNYKSFCENHAPKQKITDKIMSKAKLRLSRVKKIKREKSLQNLPNFKQENNDTEAPEEPDSICVICYETVDGYPTTQTFWPPCCARDAWFHRSCLQRMALSAGVHYLKCPLCNDKDQFSNAVLSQGYYIPDRDAAWELDQNAFSEIYERPVVCRAEECNCPRGREYDADSGMWDVKLCVLCGGPGSHSACCAAEHYVCEDCAPAAPDQAHLAAIDAVSLPTQNQSTQSSQSGPIMPSRMSLRRTKQRKLAQASISSRAFNIANNTLEDIKPKSNTELSREDLNLNSPKRPLIIKLSNTNKVENQIISPLKMLEKGLYERISSIDVGTFVLDNTILEDMKEKFRKPKPLTVKKKIVDNILEEILKNITVEHTKVKEPIKEWNSPKKCTNSQDTMSKINAAPANEEHLVKNEKEPEDKFKKNSDCEIQQKIIRNVNDHSPTTPNLKIEKNPSSIQLPAESIAKSCISFPVIDAAKKLKKINIENDSMEISENNQVVNIDLVKVQDNDLTKNIKIPEKTCSFKLSPLNKDILEKNLDIDLESFKNQYLSEVDRKFHCKFEHKHSDLSLNSKKLRTAMDFAMDVIKKPLKRKLPPADEIASKKKKSTKIVRNTNRRREVAVKDKKKLKHRQKHKTELSIRNKNISLKIRFKDEELNVKIRKPKKSRKKDTSNKPKILKQYVFTYPCEDSSPTDIITRPKTDVSPIKRKYVKADRSSDNLKQTTIQSFFAKSPTT